MSGLNPLASRDSFACQTNKCKCNICFFFSLFPSDLVRGFLCLDDPPGPFDSLEESKVRSFYPDIFEVLCRGFTALTCYRPTVRPWRRRTIGCRGSYRTSSRKSNLLDESWRFETSKSAGWRKPRSNGTKTMGVLLLT